MKNKINLGTKFIAFLALFMFSILAINVSAKAGQMKMHAIYVDRGDAIVIESNGHFMLVDSGISQTSEKVLAYLKSLNIPDKLTTLYQPTLTGTMLAVFLLFSRNMKSVR